MADTASSDMVIPEISYDDGVSTIRINTIERKGILKNKSGTVEYTTSYSNAGYVNTVEPQYESIQNTKRVIPVADEQNKGEVIEPILVRENPDGDEIIPSKPLYNYKNHHPVIVPQEADLYYPESGTRTNVRGDTSDIGLETGSVLSTTTASILKKSGDNQRRRNLQQKKISWNENVKVREPEEDREKVTVTELQREDHEYNPIDNPNEEPFHRDMPPDSPTLSPVSNGFSDNLDGKPASITTVSVNSSPPNGDIGGNTYQEAPYKEAPHQEALHQEALHQEAPPSPRRRVHPYGAEHFPERGSYHEDDAGNRWCMRITIVVLIFLVTFAIIGCIVLGLLYAWSSRVNWDQDNEDLRTKLNLQQPPTPNAQVFGAAWYSIEEGSPAYFLVMGSDSLQNQSPTSQRFMTWHRGKPIRVISTSGSGSREMVILGDPLETGGAVFSMLLETTKSYTASILDEEEFSLISFSATGGDFLTWTSNGK